MRFEYYLFYKPYQVMSQFSREGDKRTLADFFHGYPKDIYPVGRLDYDSEGLLLLTNDKRLNHLLLHPDAHYEKEYWAQVEGTPDQDQLRRLAAGVDINVNGKLYRTRPAQVKLLQHVEDLLPERDPPIRFRKSIPTSWISIRLQEGKNRQVRRMTASVQLPTLRLVRYRLGKATIQGMLPGDIRKLESGKDMMPGLEKF